MATVKYIRDSSKLQSEHHAWHRMLHRCYCQTNPAWKHYGGRGITVCQRWRDSFENFLADMGPKPSPKHSIDRIDNNGNYEPGNCRWATQTEQSRNTRRNVYVTWNNRTMTCAEWAEVLGISRERVRQRIRDFPIDEAVGMVKHVRGKGKSKKDLLTAIAAKP